MLKEACCVEVWHKVSWHRSSSTCVRTKWRVSSTQMKMYLCRWQRKARFTTASNSLEKHSRSKRNCIKVKSWGWRSSWINKSRGSRKTMREKLMKVIKVHRERNREILTQLGSLYRSVESSLLTTYKNFRRRLIWSSKNRKGSNKLLVHNPNSLRLRLSKFNSCMEKSRGKHMCFIKTSPGLCALEKLGASENFTNKLMSFDV